jgi:hypothetical protein
MQSIPGTQTCLKVGGRVRADYSMSGKQDIYSGTTGTGATINGTTGARVNTVSVDSKVQNLYGWEARGRLDLDARTATAYGTVQAVTAIRLSRTTGVLDSSGPNSAPSATTSPTRGIRAGRAMLCPVVPRGRLRRSLVVALRAHALDVLLHALLMFQASKRHSPAAGSKGHS